MSEDNKSNPPAEPGIIELDFDFSDTQVVSEVFFKESGEILSGLDAHILKLESHPNDEVLLQALFRKLHTLKGSVGAVPGGQLFGSLSHEFETMLDRLRKQHVAPNKACIELFLHSSKLLRILAENLRTAREIFPEELSEVIEVITRYGSFQMPNASASTQTASEAAFEKLSTDESGEDSKKKKDGIWLSREQMSELVRLSSEFIVLKNSVQNVDVSNSKITQVAQSLNFLSDQFQKIVEKAQKLPLREAFAGLFPLIRQASFELQKEVQLVENGFDLEVDKSLAQDLYNGLIHMIRNSLDHGIEKSDERMALGKPAQGLIRVSIEEKQSNIYCVIEDDGRGMNKERILAKAIEKGLITAEVAAHSSDEKIYAFIFHPGFSTKEKITTISGRGVGMDVVHSMVEHYKGEITVESTPGKGSKITLELPVPRQIMVEKCLLGEWKDYFLAFPLSNVSQIRSCNELQVTEVDGLRFCQHEGHTVPLLNLEEIYKFHAFLSKEEVEEMSVVFVRSHHFAIGILVSKIHHQADLVIKSFGRLVKHLPGFKGSSVLSDDQVAYVLDLDQMKTLMVKEVA